MRVFGESLGFNAGVQAREAEEQGYDGIVAVDHFFSARPPALPRWRVEPFVALGSAAATTARIQLAAMVINTNFHHPSVIAHGMASLDKISNGRAELGLGGGWYALEHNSFGLPWGDGPRRQDRLMESARICRAMLENRGVVSHRGEHFQLENAVPWEWERETSVPIIIGGARKSLLCRGAEIANRIDLLHATVDGIPVVDESLSRSPIEVERLLGAVHKHAAEAGNSVKVSATLTATIVPISAGKAARAQLAPQLRSSERLLESDLLYVIGSQQELILKITQLAGLGVDRFHLIPGPVDSVRTVSALREMLRDIQAIAA